MANGVTQAGPGHYHVRTEIEIDAPAPVVWATLTDWPNLARWSSSFIDLKGDFRSGGKIAAIFKIGSFKRAFHHTLIEFEPGVQFGWSDPLFFGMSDHHVFRVEPAGPARARFINRDQAKDGIARMLGGRMARAMLRAQQRFNGELKAEAEKRHRRGAG